MPSILIIQKPGIFADHTGRSVPEVLEEIRSKLASLRGQLHDIGHEFTGWEQSLGEAQGGCTLVISYLHGEIERMKAVQTAWANRHANSQ